MKRNQRKKRPMTLLELMIVIFIIGIISSVIGYNMKGSLEKAKAFKTKEGIKKVKEIFDLEIANGEATVNRVLKNPASVLKDSGLVSNPKELLKDGWGQPYTIKLSEKTGEIEVVSSGYSKYQSKQKSSSEDIAQIDDKLEETDEKSED